jgi:hypothetical protein
MKYLKNLGSDFKKCTRCKEFKAKCVYRENKGRGGDGLGSSCIPCLNANAKKWRDKNKERVKEYNKNYQLVKKGLATS